MVHKAPRRTGPEPKQPHANSPHLAVHPQHRLASVSSLYTEECAPLINGHAAGRHSGGAYAQSAVNALARVLSLRHSEV